LNRTNLNRKVNFLCPRARKRQLLAYFSTEENVENLHGGQKKYFQIIVETADDWIKWLNKIADSGDVIDADEWCSRFTYEVIGRVAFGEKFNTFEHRPELLHCMEVAGSFRTQEIWKRYIPNPSRTREINEALNKVFLISQKFKMSNFGILFFTFEEKI